MKYTGTYAEQQAQYLAAKADYEAKRDTAMASVSVKAGDVVEYTAIPTAILGTAEHFKGTVYMTSRGQPKVRLMGARGSKPWHKGWTKVSA